MKIVNCPLDDGNPITLFKLIKKSNIERPKINSGKTKGVDERKI